MCEIIFWGGTGLAKVLNEAISNTDFTLTAIFDNHDIPLRCRPFRSMSGRRGSTPGLRRAVGAPPRRSGFPLPWAQKVEIAARNFAPFPKARLIRGRVPESPAEAPEKVAYLSLDMNNATPELAAVSSFWDRLTPSAVIVLDDSGWAGHETQRDAIDAFAASKGCRIASLPTGQGLLIKPPT